MTKTLVLLTPLVGSELDRLIAVFADLARIVVVRTRAELESVGLDGDSTLLSFGSGIIVSKEFLEKLKRPAYNLHAASVDFPGRDPHHHAVYRHTDTYGATLHIMTPLVDDGPVVGVETFSVSLNETPSDLLARANEAGLILLERLGPSLLEKEELAMLSDINWGANKTVRADLKRLSEISPLTDSIEFSRRYRSFNVGEYDNLCLRLHGHTFRIDTKQPLPANNCEAFEGFTETAFRKLLKQLRSAGYQFRFYGHKSEEKHVIWRHDVDFSVHRALRLSEIESEEGVISTYFFNPRSVFYNLLEPEIEAMVQQIQKSGHEIGLHFDAGAYEIDIWDKEKLDFALAREKSLLELVVQQPVRVVSWHNPDQSNLLDFDAEEIGGIVNAYSAQLRSNYTYCSDSNGFWRYTPMPEIIAQDNPRLHLLTHPEWWTKNPLSPSERISRAILGRARRNRRAYDDQLVLGNRINLSY